jgi:hypothetical protein
MNAQLPSRAAADAAVLVTSANRSAAPLPGVSRELGPTGSRLAHAGTTAYPRPCGLKMGMTRLAGVMTIPSTSRSIGTLPR